MIRPSDVERLAIDGGLPLLPEGPPAWPKPCDAVREALAAAYADGSWGRYHGPHGERLCEELCELTQTRHAWLCSSGTLAVELALRGLKIGPGDEVILAAYDFPGNFRAIEAVGARPVLIDLAPATWTIDVEQVAAAAGPETKAVIASHLHGSLADMPRLNAIAGQRGLAIIEDACQAPGAVVAGRKAGSWGDCGVLSFGGSKLLTAGRGGAIVTSREEVVQRIKIYCERGNDAFPLSELQAAVLVPQIPRLASANEQRRTAALRLIELCGELNGLVGLRLANEAQHQGVLYKLPWLLSGNDDACDSPTFEQQRRRLLAAVQAEGVALHEGFRGFARRTNQRCRSLGNLQQARAAAAGTVILHHPVLLEPEETIARVACAIRKVVSSLFRGPAVTSPGAAAIPSLHPPPG
jgi:dTDP-4-amino-4,6-dideoxygalactose transaminase